MVCYVTISILFEYYYKYCGCFTKCWIWIFMTKTETAMERKYKEAIDVNQMQPITSSNDVAVNNDKE